MNRPAAPLWRRRAPSPVVEEEEEEDDDAEQLWTARSRSRTVPKSLHNTQMKLKRGHKYGPLGGSDGGKRHWYDRSATASSRASAGRRGQDRFVEADILGELPLRVHRLHLQRPAHRAHRLHADEVAKMMATGPASPKRCGRPGHDASGADAAAASRIAFLGLVSRRRGLSSRV